MLGDGLAQLTALIMLLGILHFQDRQLDVYKPQYDITEGI